MDIFDMLKPIGFSGWKSLLRIIRRFFSIRPKIKMSECRVNIGCRLMGKHATATFRLNLSIFNTLQSGSHGLLMAGTLMPAPAPSYSLVIRDMFTEVEHLYSPASGDWSVRDAVRLNEYERQVLQMSGYGWSVEKVAQVMHKSVDSIRKYRSSLYDKLNVHSMHEAILAAVAEGYL